MQKSKAKTVDAYIAEAPPEHQRMMKQLRGIIKDIVPAETTEGISYRMPMYKYKGMLLGYAAFNEHVGFYAISSAILKRHAEELEGYTTGKGSVQLPVGRKLPVVMVRAMITERVAEKDAAALKKPARKKPAARKKK